MIWKDLGDNCGHNPEYHNVLFIDFDPEKIYTYEEINDLLFKLEYIVVSNCGD